MRKMHSVKINGKKVYVTGEHVEAFMASILFKQWCNRLDAEFLLQHIKIQSIDFVERAGQQEILFAKFKACYESNGRMTHSIVFMRGGAVILFIILVSNGFEFVVTVSEERLPSGDYKSVGLPAGMLDGNKNPLAVAVKELQEETRIIIEPEKFINMTQKYYGDAVAGVDVSRGGSDEYYQCFFARIPVTDEELHAIHGRKAGSLHEAENTTVLLALAPELLRISPQASTFIAYGLYKELRL